MSNEKESIAQGVFNTLAKVDVSAKTEKKNGLTYLSWAFAWAELKKVVPDATYTVYENAQGWMYHTDGKTCWVKCGVTVNGLEYIEYLPIMDFRNQSIPAERVTSFDANKAVQRCVTKAIAKHGLGLGIYAGEDIMDNEPKAEEKPKKETPKPQVQAKPITKEQTTRISDLCTVLKKPTDDILKAYKIQFLNQLSESQGNKIIARLEEMLTTGEKK